MSKPDIRFNGFNGEWTEKTFEDLVDVQSGRDYKHLSEGTIPVYGTGGYMLSVDEALSYNEDAVGIGRKGTIDKPYILKAPFWTVDTLFYSIPKNKMNLDFIFSAFQTIRWKDKDESTGVPSLSKNAINSTEIKIPNESAEQKKLGALFSQIDSLIASTQKEHDKLVTLKKCMLQKMFPKKGSLIPEIRFEGFSGDWVEKKLGEFGDVCMCKRIFKEQTSDKGDIPFYKIGTFGGIADSFISKTLFEEYKNNYPYPQKGAILISASGSIGRTVIYQGKDEYFQDSNIVWLEHNDNILDSFLKILYDNLKWNGIEGTTIKRLYNNNILNQRVTVPSLPEQQKIGAYFQNLDNLISKQAAVLEKLKNVKKTLLGKMFV